MAYHSNNRNPFFAEEEDDDDSFARNENKDPFMVNAETEFQQIQQLRQQSMNRQLESTKRAMASICDSEAVGVTTAEELVHQGEQLDNVETKLDLINQDMKTSQRHINNIKSIFGGIKNWWSGNKGGINKEPVQSESSPRLQGCLDDSLQKQAKGTHPALQMRSEDIKGFYEDEFQSISTSSGQKQISHQTTKGFSSEPATRDKAWCQYEQHLDSNIDELSSGLSRLKNLGVGLGEEIERQNTQVDRITTKSDRANVTLEQQNKQMRQILK